MIMPLELKMPDLSEDQRSPLLTLADIEEMNARCARRSSTVVWPRSVSGRRINI